MTLTFSHTTAAQRVHFGAGRAPEHVRAEVERAGAARVMLIAGGSSAAVAARITEGVPVALVWTDVAQHVPVEAAIRAREAAASAAVDLLVCVGGGSTVGMAKAVALTHPVPIIAVPTTYAGSEATDVWGLTENGRKTTGSDSRVLPAAVVYDVTLTAGLDPRTAVASALNGVAHCVDSFWAPRADPLNATLGGEGLRALAIGARAMAADPAQESGRESAQYGAYLAAVAFASAGSGMHHKICHALGGTLGLPHAETHAVVLPHVAAFNLPASPDARRRISAALAGESAGHGADALGSLHALYSDVGAPRALRELGMREQDIALAVDVILPTIPPSNPRPVDGRALAALLTDAWAGGAAG